MGAMNLDTAMARMGLDLPDHLKPAVQAKQEPKKLTIKEQKALEEKALEEKRRKKAAKLAALAGGAEPKEKKEKVPAKKKEEKKEAPAAAEPKAASSKETPSKEASAAWNEVGKVKREKVGAAMEDGPVMPYMKYELPWMKYTARTKAEIEAVEREAATETERATREQAAAAAAATRQAEAAEVRRDIGNGKVSLDMVEWQTLFIAAEPLQA